MVGKKVGPYLIQEKLGEGGMGVVYKAVHAQIEQIVAIKAIYPQYAKDQSFRERFRREARVQAKLHHPNVVNIFNYLEDDEENLYIVMEYVYGGTLESKLSKEKLTLEEIVSITVQILNALSYMHSNGIVHRDIKPSNIMFSEGLVKVSDFGIAKSLEERGLTKTGTVMGTVWYMAPEIIQGEEASYSSDLYAVGVILYQMLTGRVPFFGKTDFEIMKAHLEKEPTPPRELNPSLPEGIEIIVRKALAKKREERFSSADEFKKALLDWFSTVTGKTFSVESVLSPSPITRKRIILTPMYLYMITGVLLLLLFVITIILLLFLRRDKPKDVPELLKRDALTAPLTIQPPQDKSAMEEADTSEPLKEEKREQETPKEEPPAKSKAVKKKDGDRKREITKKEKEKTTTEEIGGGDGKWKVIK